jgi:beta-phosphoglucomutase-like phosphatase (HAD superfamily)
LSDVKFDFVLAGDVVGRKKPDPEIYQLALSRGGLAPDEAFAVEDSKNGVVAAVGAGLPVVATTNYYTENEDVSGARIIVTCLGDPDGEKARLRKGDLDFDGVLRVKQVADYVS